MKMGKNMLRQPYILKIYHWYPLYLFSISWHYPFNVTGLKDLVSAVNLSGIA